MLKMRAEITKGEELRYISHLDYAAAIGRAIRRAKLPAAYSEGFNPHLKIAFSSALGLGVTSDAEYMDIEFKEDVSPEEVAAKLLPMLPLGVQLKRIKVLHGKKKALMATVDLAVYEIRAPLKGERETAQKAVQSYNAAKSVVCIRQSPKKGEKQIESKQYLAGPVQITFTGGQAALRIALKLTPAGSVKASEVFEALVEKFALPVEEDEAFIHCCQVLAAGKNPMEL